VAKPCKCSNSQVFQYRSRLSGPLLDRIDLKLHLERVESEKFLKKDRCESSASVLARVQHCRTLQLHRQGYVNRWIPAAELLSMCDLQAGAAEVLHNAAEQFQLSQRGLHSALRTARTIADLADAKRVGPHHVVEALSYRSDALNGVNRFESR